MDNKILVATIEKLLSKPQISKKEIIDSIKVSSRQLDEVINYLNSGLNKWNARIEENKQLKSYSLKIEDYHLFKEYFRKLINNQSFYNNQHERIRFILIQILTQKGFLKIEELADSLYVSSRQISKDLQFVREFLARFNLIVKSTPHYGLEVIGSELRKRICLAEIYSQNSNSNSMSMFIKDNMDEISRQNMIDDIRTTVSDILNQHNYLISDTIFENLVVHLFVAILRIQSGNEIDFGDTEVFIQNEMEISQDIVQALSRKFKIQFNKNECAYVTAHLKCKRSFDLEYSESIPPEIGDLVIDILERIDDRYNTNFRNDFKLCMILSLHCVSLINRIRYGFNQKNPLLEEIKTRFIYEYELAEEGCKVINEKYNCEVTEDEIGYFALDIRTAIEKRYGNEKKNILLVCSTGRGSAELMKIKFEKHFIQFVNNIDLCSSREAESINLNQYDYIFTTVPLLVKTKTPIFRISCFLGQEDIVEINGVFRTVNPNKKLLDYLHKDLFMGLCDFSNKEEAIEKMVQHIRLYKKIPDCFLKSVLEREKEANTSFGNKVAFPHPSELLTEETFVSIAVLKKPIQWGRSKIQLILLASIENKKDKNLQDFYKMISRIINNPKNVDRLIKKPSYETLCELIFNE